jgi:hypothetical protein
MRVSGRHHSAAVFVAAAALVATSGCRSGGLLALEGPQLESPLEPATAAAGQPPASAARTIPLEITFVRYDAADPLIGTELWTFLDEQAFDPALRRQLATNGLRCGIVTGDLPTHIAERLAAAHLENEADAPLPGGMRRTLRLLPGKRADVVAAAAVPDLVLLEGTADGPRGHTLHDAGGFIVVRAWPAADGRVKIEAVPEIRHGPLRRSWVGEEGMFRLEAAQTRHRFDHVRIVATLPPQGRLVIACGGEPAATVGDALLREGRADGVASQRLLVIRPAAGGADPAFGGDGAGGED